MNQVSSELQGLIDGFRNETATEDKRISILNEIAKSNEEIAVELISNALKKKPSLSFTTAVVSVLPKLESEKSYDLAQKYTGYLLKYDIEKLPKHIDILIASLFALNEFDRPESADIILSAYARFRNNKHDQNAIVSSGIYSKLLNSKITGQQKAELLVILGEYDKLSSAEKNEEFYAAFRKIVKMHSDTNHIKNDLKFLRKNGEMELYREIIEKVRSKFIPDVIIKAVIIAAAVVVVAFIIFFFTMLYGKQLSHNAIISKITGFGITAFVIFILVGTIVLFRYKNK